MAEDIGSSAPADSLPESDLTFDELYDQFATDVLRVSYYYLGDRQRAEDVTQDGKWIHIQRQYRYETDEIVEHTKGTEGDRFVPLPEVARQIIEMARASQMEHGTPHDGFIFSSNDLPLPYQPVQYLFEKYSARLETVQKSSHKARKTYISSLIDVGINLNSVREYVGHSDERTTLHNYCFDRNNDEQRLAMVEKAVTVAH